MLAVLFNSICNFISFKEPDLPKKQSYDEILKYINTCHQINKKYYCCVMVFSSVGFITSVIVVYCNTDLNSFKNMLLNVENVPALFPPILAIAFSLLEMQNKKERLNSKFNDLMSDIRGKSNNGKLTEEYRSWLFEEFKANFEQDKL